MKRLRVAILMNAFWNNGSGTSGSDQRAVQLAKRFGKKFDVEFFTSPEGGKLVDKSNKVIFSPSSTECKNIFRCYIKRTGWLSFELLKREYDIIYSTSDFFPDVLPVFRYLRKNKETKWIQIIHHSYTKWSDRPGNKVIALIGQISQRYSFGLIQKSASQVLAVSKHVKDDLIANGFRKNIIVVPNGIQLEDYDKIKTNEKSKNQAVFLGRLNPAKGIFDLPLIWKEVLKNIPEARLQVIGGGNQQAKEELVRRIEKFNLGSSITVRGFLPDSKAFPIIKSSQVFVFPSHEEGWGIAIAESLACKVPVIAWDLPVYRDVFFNSIAKVPEGNIKAFAEKVIDMLNNRSHSDMIAKKGYEFIKRYSWDEIAEREIKLIEELCEKR